MALQMVIVPPGWGRGEREENILLEKTSDA